MPVDLGEAMIALRSANTCRTGTRKGITEESCDDCARAGGWQHAKRRLFFLKTDFIWLALLMVVLPDLIGCKRANAQQNNYHTTAGRHSSEEDHQIKTSDGQQVSDSANEHQLTRTPSPGDRFQVALDSLARIERASIATGSPSDQADGANHFADEREEEATGGFVVATGNTRAQADEPAATGDGLARAADSAGSHRNQLNPDKLHIVRLFAPEAVKNGTQNVTIDCMFKFDKKLDQRLTIKWFFNDEQEPIYQWIPELNKRVFSDKYERFLDKSYEVSEDADFMLQAYRWLLSGGASNGNHQADNSATTDELMAAERAQLESSRRTLASRLNKLAKLGSQHSRHLLDSLRAALNMDQLDYSRFRALRLLKPTTELNGRFTCSVSSLDGDDLHSTRLLVYEPAKSFQFNVSRVAGQPQYNLTCRADQLFPRPSLALIRYRAGPLEPQQVAEGLQLGRGQHAHRPRLAATLLKQEPVPGTQTQILVGPVGRVADNRHSTNQFSTVKPETDFDTAAAAEPNEIVMQPQPVQSIASEPQTTLPTVYEISSWALIDEASLSSNVVTQFECLLSIEGTGYEQRHSLALQRGWHVNSAASVAVRATLVGLFSALASLLCLVLALVSSMLIFRLLRRHAKNRVHERKSDSSGSSSTNSSPPTGEESIGTLAGKRHLPADRDELEHPPPPPPSMTRAEMLPQLGSKQTLVTSRQQVPPDQSDNIYRVPFGTRFVIGPGSRSAQQQFYGPPTGAGTGPLSFVANSFATALNN